MNNSIEGNKRPETWLREGICPYCNERIDVYKSVKTGKEYACKLNSERNNEFHQCSIPILKIVIDDLRARLLKLQEYT